MSGSARCLLLAVLFTVGATTAAAADKTATVPVHFARGASSADLQGSFRGYDTVHYTVGARAGQVMTVRITGSSNANFHVLPVGAVPGHATAIGSGYVGGDWTGVLPASGTYVIQVYQMRATARRGTRVAYTLHVGISDGADATTTPSDDRDARDGRRDYDASGFLPCAHHAGQPTGQCPFTVTRGPGGAATVVVTHPDGLKRTLIFEGGKAVGAGPGPADAGLDFHTSKEVDLFFVRVGTERYEVPEVVVVGD